MRDYDSSGDLSALDQRLEQMHTSGHPSLRVEESFAVSAQPTGAAQRTAVELLEAENTPTTCNTSSP